MNGSVCKSSIINSDLSKVDISSKKNSVLNRADILYDLMNLRTTEGTLVRKMSNDHKLRPEN